MVQVYKLCYFTIFALQLLLSTDASRLVNPPTYYKGKPYQQPLTKKELNLEKKKLKIKEEREKEEQLNSVKSKASDNGGININGEQYSEAATKDSNQRLARVRSLINVAFRELEETLSKELENQLLRDNDPEKVSSKGILKKATSNISNGLLDSLNIHKKKGDQYEKKTSKSGDNLEKEDNAFAIQINDKSNRVHEKVPEKAATKATLKRVNCLTADITDTYIVDSCYADQNDRNNDEVQFCEAETRKCIEKEASIRDIVNASIQGLKKSLTEEFGEEILNGNENESDEGLPMIQSIIDATFKGLEDILAREIDEQVTKYNEMNSHKDSKNHSMTKNCSLSKSYKSKDNIAENEQEPKKKKKNKSQNEQ